MNGKGNQFVSLSALEKKVDEDLQTKWLSMHFGNSEASMAYTDALRDRFIARYFIHMFSGNQVLRVAMTQQQQELQDRATFLFACSQKLASISTACQMHLEKVHEYFKKHGMQTKITADLRKHLGNVMDTIHLPSQYLREYTKPVELLTDSDRDQVTKEYVSVFTQQKKLREAAKVVIPRVFVPHSIEKEIKVVVNAGTQRKGDVAPDAPRTQQQEKMQKRLERVKKEAVKKILEAAFPMHKVPFKSKDECLSKATKKPYYISKQDLVKLIDEDPELKSFFKKGYKTLTKEKICSKIFDDDANL